ncbi:transglutaminase domain-containing protein [Spirosoma arcticum]
MRNYVIPPILALFIILFNGALTPPAHTGREIPRPSKYVQIDYSAIDNYARNAPASAARNLNTLSAYLTSPAKSDLAKARSVYAWITAHIRYDEQAFSGQKYSSEVEYANRSLRSRKAVCTGFALLFKHLLKPAGIDVANIKGYARTFDSEAGQPIQRVDHEWNAVRLDGDWYLLDIAWAQTTAKKGPSGEPKPNDYFFLTEPIEFAANHFPTDPRWQLLETTISKAQFDRFPKLYDAYFRLGFDEQFPETGLIRASDALTLTLRNDKDVEFMCALGRVGGSESATIPVSVQRSGETYRLTVSLPERGNSTLLIFAKPKGSRSERVKSYEGIASFTVVKG